MADSEVSTPLPNNFLMPNPTSSHVQTSETSPPPPFQHPGYTNYSSLSYETGAYHHMYPGQHGGHVSDSNQGLTAPFHYHNRLSHHHHFVSHTPPRAPTFYSPPLDLFGQSMNPNMPPRPFNNMQMPIPGQQHSDISDNRPEVDLFHPSIPSGAHAYPYPSYTHVPPPQLNGFGSFPTRGSIDSTALHSQQQGRFVSDGFQSMNQGRMPTRGFNPHHTPSDQLRQVSTPHRRPSYDRPHLLPGSGSQDRRPQSFLGTHSRRSDRSVSPRTSHRRSFDRYSTDLHPSSNPSDPDEPAAVRARLAHRRIRDRRFVRHFAVDDNTPTPNQMQTLRDQLRHFLPSQLPEDASTCCDICQKDYSAKHCLPTEEDEVAIQLPCKHIFGEHCINTWFDTCKAHKNKITCPMCRKLLIEPVRAPPAALIPAVPEVISFIARGSQGINLSQADQQTFLRLAGTSTSARAQEGDF